MMESLPVSYPMNGSDVSAVVSEHIAELMVQGATAEFFSGLQVKDAHAKRAREFVGLA
jgi:hypothetical protein